jgi:hypothetical protein
MKDYPLRGMVWSVGSALARAPDFWAGSQLKVSYHGVPVSKTKLGDLREEDVNRG